MSAPSWDGQWRHALVVFTDATDLWWLRLLRRGFRHCFVALSMPEGWVVVDPLSHRTCITWLPISQEFDLAGWYRQQGMAVVTVGNHSSNERIAPILPYSCVESVKRILGVQAAFVLTPWQLYRHLNKNGTFPVDASE